ncbi:hypothetical protein BGW80DRAFT_1435618 [Lactifluus volemus]|nr:hypothetical protein BGW80DRAFT_1435618 [Lactifluus volemus]
MKYIALLSGGKDSCYNLLYCHKNGHKLVAAASLRPDPAKALGQDAIEFVARALDVPLYRRVIGGTALAQDSEYGSRNAEERGGVNGDETEDLYALLSDVKSQHPDAKGVSTSCQRLSLTPLSYLWQRNQGELLSEMIMAGMKPSSSKLRGSGSIPRISARLCQKCDQNCDNTLYGSHICGEGEQQLSILVPTLLDQPYHDIAEDIQTQMSKNSQSPRRIEPQDFQESSTGTQTTSTSICFGNWISIGNVHRDTRDMSDMPLEDEVRECFHILQRHLSEHSLSLSHIANMNIFISSMEDFASINVVYASYFGVSPPARACVSVDLPYPLRVMLDCVAYSEQKASDRQALHVQGLSYWAPANIGPYSQAIIVDERVFVSGQIGLIPCSLTMPSPQSLSTEIPLVSQHADRIVKALSNHAGGGWDGHAQLILYWLTQQHHISYAVAASQTLDGDATPTLFLTVKGLPKDALIEKQVLHHTGRGCTVDEEGDIAPVSCPPIYSSETFAEAEVEVRYEVTCLKHAASGASAAVICGKGYSNSNSNWGNVSSRLKTATHLEGVLLRALSVRMFYKHAATAITHVPCHLIHTRDGNDWDYALCILAT